MTSSLERGEFLLMCVCRYGRAILDQERIRQRADLGGGWWCTQRSRQLKEPGVTGEQFRTSGSEAEHLQAQGFHEVVTARR